MKRRNLPFLWLVVPGAFLATIAFWSLRSCSPLEAKSPAAATVDSRNLRKEAKKRLDFETWNQRFSKQLPPPPQLRPLAEEGTGVLPNGLRYVVLRHAENPGEVSLRLQIRVGSIHENDDERGFAHFVENLAFALHSAALFKGLRVAERLPIGLKETVETATLEKLRAFWQKHYVAPQMSLVIVATHPQQATKLQAFLDLFAIPAFDIDAALHYAEIRADLEAVGKSIGPLDLLIAAQTHCYGISTVPS